MISLCNDSYRVSLRKVWPRHNLRIYIGQCLAQCRTRCALHMCTSARCVGKSRDGTSEVLARTTYGRCWQMTSAIISFDTSDQRQPALSSPLRHQYCRGLSSTDFTPTMSAACTPVIRVESDLTCTYHRHPLIAGCLYPLGRSTIYILRVKHGPVPSPPLRSGTTIVP